MDYGYQLCSYSLDHLSDVNGQDASRSFGKSDAKVVLIHRYFGFDTLMECESVIEKYRQKGVVFIEDRNHNVYTVI